MRTNECNRMSEWNTFKGELSFLDKSYMWLIFTCVSKKSGVDVKEKLGRIWQSLS